LLTRRLIHAARLVEVLLLAGIAAAWRSGTVPALAVAVATMQQVEAQPSQN